MDTEEKKVELSDYAQEYYVNDLVEVTDEAVIWRKSYFNRIIEKALTDIDEAHLILYEIDKEIKQRGIKE